jgi:hypothetical protein
MRFVKVLPIVAALAAISTAQAAPIAAGDIVLYRVGTGSGSLTSAAANVFLDEYTQTGTFVQSIAMPTAVSGSNNVLTASGSATSEGELTLSADGRYLVLTGYNASVGTGSVKGTSGNRTVGLVDMNGNTNTSTVLTDSSFAGDNIRSAVSTNGTDLWVAGTATSAANGGVRYTTVGSTTSTQLSTTVPNVRQVEIFNGQLYASDGSGSTNRISTVGNGQPTTSGQTMTNLPGIPASGTSPYTFFMADLNAGVAGMDTLYVADDAAGVTKYSLTGGTWVSNGTVVSKGTGLAGVITGGNVQLFETSGGNKLVSILDTSGYNGTFSATANTIATAATNTAFRGLVVTVPEPETYAMLLAGLGLLGFAARRRNK